MIFQDYYHWFTNTLRIAQTVKSVNWVFKEHPYAWFYPTKDLCLMSMFARLRSSHVRFLDAQADFNACSLRYIADTIVTCVGTAGLEYSALGIPCVLGGESTYSGFGFTIEPENREEYEACLRNMGELIPLTNTQVKVAKVVAYFYFCLMQSAVYYFCPYFDDNEIANWNVEHDRKLWKKATAQLRDEQHVEKMRSQMQEMFRFVCDSSWTQYIDLKQFPFLQDDGSLVK